MTTAGMTDDVRENALTVWNYHRLNHPLRRADAILVLCSHDTAVAERGASLFLDEWAPWLIYSGGQGAITRQIWNEPEADLFARIAVERGVPADRILIENASTNTGENIQFTRRLLAERGLDPASFIVVQKPYMHTYKATLKAFSQVPGAPIKVDTKKILKNLTAIKLIAFCDDCQTNKQGIVAVDNVVFEK